MRTPSTAVRGVGILGGSDHIGVREGIKKSTYLVTIAKFPLIPPIPRQSMTIIKCGKLIKYYPI